MTGAWLAVKVNMSSRGAMVVKWLTVAVIAVIILKLALS